MNIKPPKLGVTLAQIYLRPWRWGVTFALRHWYAQTTEEQYARCVAHNTELRAQLRGAACDMVYMARDLKEHTDQYASMGFPQYKLRGPEEGLTEIYDIKTHTVSLFPLMHSWKISSYGGPQECRLRASNIARDFGKKIDESTYDQLCNAFGIENDRKKQRWENSSATKEMLNIGMHLIERNV